MTRQQFYREIWLRWIKVNNLNVKTSSQDHRMPSLWADNYIHYRKEEWKKLIRPYFTQDVLLFAELFSSRPLTQTEKAELREGVKEGRVYYTLQNIFAKTNNNIDFRYRNTVEKKLDTWFRTSKFMEI